MRKATKSLLVAALRKDNDIAKLKTQKEELQSQLDEASLDVFFARWCRNHEKGWLMRVAVSRKKVVSLFAKMVKRIIDHQRE